MSWRTRRSSAATPHWPATPPPDGRSPTPGRTPSTRAASAPPATTTSACCPKRRYERGWAAATRWPSPSCVPVRPCSTWARAAASTCCCPPAGAGVLGEVTVRARRGCGNPGAVAGLRPGETVPDVGSGGGIAVLLSARRVGEHGKVYGLDASADMLALARRNAEQAGARNV